MCTWCNIMFLIIKIILLVESAYQSNNLLFKQVVQILGDKFPYKLISKKIDCKYLAIILLLCWLTISSMLLLYL